MPKPCDTMILYQRLQQIYVLLDDGDRRALRAIQLTPSQFNLLRMLGLQPGRDMTITALSQALLCTRSNITRLVQRLEQAGLVQRSSDPADQRLVRITLSATGAQALSDAAHAHRQAVQRRLGSLNAETQALLCRMSEQIVTLLESDLAQQPALPPGELDPVESDTL
jgi:DNA-binding MarR family transcriptional regulator